MTLYYPYAAQKAERLGNYADAQCLYKYAAAEAESQEDRVVMIEAHHRCKQLAQEAETSTIIRPEVKDNNE